MRATTRNGEMKGLVIGLLFVAALVVAGVFLFTRSSNAPIAKPVGGKTQTVGSVGPTAKKGSTRPMIRTVEADFRPDHTSGRQSDTAPVPADLVRALSLEDPAPYQERQAAVQELRARMISQAETEALASFALDQGQPKGVSQGEKLALTNEILNVLGRQPAFHDRFREMLISLYDDASRPLPLRNYALQHLAELEGDSIASQGSAHWRAVNGPESSLAATAMLHLLSVSRHTSLSDAARTNLATRAFKLAAQDSSPADTRLTALQVAAELNHRDAPALALELARGEDNSFPLRIAAIAALGKIGDGTGRSYVESLIDGPNMRLRSPAKTALQEMDQHE